MANVATEQGLLIGGRRCGDWDTGNNSENLGPGRTSMRMRGSRKKANAGRNSPPDCGSWLGLHSRTWGQWDWHTDDVGGQPTGSLG